MNKKRLIIGGILVILIIIIVIFCSIYFRSKNKINVVLKVSENVLELNDDPKRNMYIKQSYNDIYFTETYKYNGIEKSIEYYKEDAVKYTDIRTSDKTYMYLETDDGATKLMTIIDNDEENNYDYVNFEDMADDYSYIKTISETISVAKNIKLSSEKFQNKDCYVIEYTDSSLIQYIDKKTYLPLKIVSDETDIQIYEYSFDTVTESDVSLLDESAFTLLSEEEFENYNLWKKSSPELFFRI